MIIKKLKPVPGGTFPGAEYNEKKVREGVAELAGWANVSGNFIHSLETLHSIGVDCGHDVEEYLQSQSQTFGNTKSTRWQLHLALSCKGHEKTKDQLVDIANSLMREYGYGDQPYLIYFHQDTNNNHVHIISTRIDRHGMLIPDHNDYRILNSALNKVLGIEQKNDRKRLFGYSFTTMGQLANIADDMNYSVGKADEKANEVPFYHGGAVAFSIPQSDIVSAMTKQQENDEEMKQRKAAAKRLKAILVKYRELSLKQELETMGSQKDNAKKEEKRKTARNRREWMTRKYSDIRSDIKKLRDKDGKPLSELEQYRMNWFMDEIHAKLGITIHFQKDKNGIVRGYGIVDHKNKIALDGSDVMKLTNLVNLTPAISKGRGSKTTTKVNSKAQKNSSRAAQSVGSDSPTGQCRGRTPKATVYVRDASLDIYRSIFGTRVISNGRKSMFYIAFHDGSVYRHELTDEQTQWYSNASSNDERDDIAIRLAAFYFPRQIYDAYRRQLMKEYVQQRSKSFRLHPNVYLRCYKSADGNWYLETDGLRCKLKYTLEKDEVRTVYKLQRKTEEFAAAKKEFFFNHFLKEEIDDRSRYLSCPSTSNIVGPASVNDVKAYSARHLQAMQSLSCALSVNSGSSANREYEVGGHSILDDIDDEQSFRRRNGIHY